MMVHDGLWLMIAGNRQFVLVICGLAAGSVVDEVDQGVWLIMTVAIAEANMVENKQ